MFFKQTITCSKSRLERLEQSAKKGLILTIETSEQPH